MHGVDPSPPVAARLARRASDWLGAALGAVAALIVVAEICVLLAGVCARYFLRSPLIWTDELAGMLFLWLAMLGAVLALHRGEHMRMTALSNRLPRAARVFLERFATFAAIAFVLLIISPAYDFAVEDMDITTPALELSSGWRSVGLPIGFGLMFVVAALQLVEAREFRITLAAFAASAALITVFAAFGPRLGALGNLNLILFFVVIVGALVLAATPIAFAFALATFGYIALTTSTPATVIVGRMDEGMSHLVLLAVPLFVFLGLLIETTGMARAMVAFLASLLGHVRGGLQYVLIGAMYLVSGISGSKAADMAAVAPALFPEMIGAAPSPAIS